jgi:uncharacterized protein (DUF302 family)
MEQPLAYQIRIQGGFEQVVEVVIDALIQKGFGVLTQIDVKSTLKEKLVEEFRPYMILGACNPPLAYRALTTDPNVGVMMPCNVTVEEIDGEILTSLANPEGMLMVGNLAQNPSMQAVAQ